MRTDCNKLLKCDFCHKTGHLKGNGYKLIGYPADYKGKRDTIVAGNSTYHTGHVSQQYQSDKTKPIQSSHNPQMQSSYHNQMQVQFPYIPSSQQNESQQHVPMPLFTPLQHQKLLKMLDEAKLDDISGTANMTGNHLPSGASLKWIIDTGASHHLVRDPTCLYNSVLIETAGQV